MNLSISRIALDAWEETLFVREGGKDVLLRLIGEYGSQGRYHHTLRHVVEVTKVLCDYRNKLPNFTTAVCAALWHNIVYDARRDDNKERCVKRWFFDADSLAVRLAKKERVAQLIMATKSLETSDGATDMKFFLDANLSFLGQSSKRYAEYMNGIRHEFAHLTEDKYRKERLDVLRLFLGRDKIYLTQSLREKYEKNARRFIKEEIKILESPDTFHGEWTDSGGLCQWKIRWADFGIFETFKPYLKQEFSFTEFSESLPQPEKIGGSLQSGTHRLQWDWSPNAGFALEATEKKDEAILKQIADFFQNRIQENEFNIHRRYAWSVEDTTTEFLVKENLPQ